MAIIVWYGTCAWDARVSLLEFFNICNKHATKAVDFRNDGHSKIILFLVTLQCLALSYVLAKNMFFCSDPMLTGVSLLKIQVAISHSEISK